MPQPFSDAIMTDAAVEMILRAQAGEISIKFTRIAVGNGEYTDEEKQLDFLQRMTELKSEKNSFSLSGIEKINTKCIKVTALVTNQDPATKRELVTGAGYYINEIGLYAKPSDGTDEDEVLYSIAVTTGDHGDYMPPYNGMNPAQIIQEFYATVDNSQSVSIETTGAAMLYDDAERMIQSIALDFINQFFSVDAVNRAFDAAFPTEKEESGSMSAGQIVEALSTEWNGESSTDPYALKSNNVVDALSTEWNGESSTDPYAMDAEEVSEALKNAEK